MQLLTSKEHKHRARTVCDFSIRCKDTGQFVHHVVHGAISDFRGLILRAESVAPSRFNDTSCSVQAMQR